MGKEYFKNDLDIFMDIDGLGDKVTYDGRTFGGQFFNEYEAIDVFGIDIDSRTPVVIVKESDVPDIKVDHKIRVDGVLYYVKSIEPDGIGLTTLKIGKDA